MALRFNAYTKTTYDFLKEIFVQCPRCSCKARVISTGNLQDRKLAGETKVTCGQCGYNKILAEMPKDVVKLSSGKPVEVRHFYMNVSIDPFFRLPLWLQKELREGTLWAYNYEHLDFLDKHIAAGLRERGPEDTSNRSIGSRLPRWMSAAKNREELKNGIKKLREK